MLNLEAEKVWLQKTLKQWRSEFVSRWSNNQFIDRYIWDSNWTWEQIQSFFAVRASSHHQCVSCASSLCLSITHSDTFTPTHTESEPSVLAEVGHSLSLSLPPPPHFTLLLTHSPSTSPFSLTSLCHFAISPVWRDERWVGHAFLINFLDNTKLLTSDPLAAAMRCEKPKAQHEKNKLRVHLQKQIEMCHVTHLCIELSAFAITCFPRDQ